MIVSHYVVYHNTHRNQQDNNHPYDTPNYQNHLQGNIDIPNRFNTGSNASAINVNIRTSMKNCFHRGCFNFHSLNLFGFLARSYAPDFSPIRSVHQLGSTMFPNNFKSRINLVASSHQVDLF